MSNTHSADEPRGREREERPAGDRSDAPRGGDPEGWPAAQATDVTRQDVAQRRGFNGDAVAPVGNPAADPLGSEGEPEQPGGSTHNETAPESRMTADPAPDPEPRDADASPRERGAGVPAPGSDAPSAAPSSETPSRDDRAAGRRDLP